MSNYYFLFPFHRWRKWDTERLSCLPNCIPGPSQALVTDLDLIPNSWLWACWGYCCHITGVGIWASKYKVYRGPIPSWPGSPLTVASDLSRGFTTLCIHYLEYYLIWSKTYIAQGTIFSQIRSDQISCSVVSDSLRPHESQHARPLCPSPTPRVHSDSRLSSQWCHPAISSSVVNFIYGCHNLNFMEFSHITKLFFFAPPNFKKLF